MINVKSFITLQDLLIRFRQSVLIFILLICAHMLHAQIAANYQVGTWSQFKTAAVTYTLDDNCSNQIPVALPLFDQYGYKVTFYTVINWSPNWSGLQKASANGHEVGSHTMSHPTSLAALSISSQDTELKQSQSTINTNITNAKCVTLAYPNCVASDLTTTQKYYIAARNCQGRVEAATPSDFYNISSIITGSTGSVQKAADLNSKVDAAKSSKGWCVFLTHGIDSDGGYSPTQSSELKTHLAYVNTNKADFWVGTFVNVVKYIRERNAANLSEITITSDSLQLTASDNLDNTVYNVPITVRRVLPSGWQNPRVYIGGKIATSTLVTSGGTTYIMFDVIPDQGKVYLANGKVTTTTPAPAVTSPVTYCQNVQAVALTATGTSLKWYTAATGGTGTTTAPVPSTATAGTTNYYVTQTLNGVESARSLIAVTVNAAPSAPAVTSPVTYCQNASAAVLTASGTSLKWYSTATGGTGSSTAPTPSTASAGTVNYYVSQTVNGCESSRALIAVTVNATPAVPAVASPVTYCQNASAAALTASGTSLKWYTAATGGTGLSTAPTPSASVAGTVNYYVSQTVNGCESSRAMIAVTVNATPAAPAVASPVTYCQNASAAALTASGTSLKWYAAATGGTGSSTAPTPSASVAGTVNYYVSQTVNGCESSRAMIAVTVNATPAAPAVTSPVTYCQNASASALTAAGVSLKWYAVATGGNGASVAPVPSTAAAGTSSFYVSQTVNGCESNRTAMTVTVNALPPAPAVTSPVNYCQNDVAAQLSAAGSSLKWYSDASGGVASATAPTPLTSIAGTTNYYVSQTINGCEGGRESIAVVVNALPVATITPSGATSFVPGDSVTLSAPAGNGLSYIWFNGTTQAGTGRSYVARSSGNYTVEVINAMGCKSFSTMMQVTVTSPSNQLPEVTITAPAATTTYVAPANITVAATASDPDGTIASVAFYEGIALLNTDASAPYNVSLNNLAPGTYTITAVATDNTGATAISVPLTLVVNANQPSVITITSPTANSTVTGSPLTINVTVTDQDGGITGVEYYDGNTLIGSSTTAPYSFIWNNPSAGTHDILVKVTDSNGGVTVSAPVTVTVTEATGILSSNELNAYSNIYPNPANAQIRIETDKALAGASLKLLDVFGMEWAVPFSVTGNNATADVSNLENGVYVLVITKDSFSIRKQIVVAR